MTKRVVTKKLVDQLFNSFREDVGHVFGQPSPYIFIGDHLTEGETEEDVADILLSDFALHHNVFRNMIGLKKLYQTDTSRCILRYIWQPDRVYAMYDNMDPDLDRKRYYAIVPESDNYYVFKCLYNNGGVPSTVKPEYIQDLEEEFIKTADGYEWQFVATIPTFAVEKFGTEKYIPIDFFTEVAKPMINGAITQFKIDSPGQNYRNFIVDRFFNEDRDDSLREFRLPEYANPIENFYKNTIIHITDPNSTIKGQWRRVKKSYVREGTGRVFIELDTSFNVPIGGIDDIVDGVPSGLQYEIWPEVAIFGDGSELNSAVAYAKIDPEIGYGVEYVEILEPGSNYNFAIAEVRQGEPDEQNGVAVFPVKAQVRPIIPPPGGHGSNIPQELNARALAISSEIDDLLITGNTFAQFGIITNPLLNDVWIETKSGDQSPDPRVIGVEGSLFSAGEEFIHFSTVPLNLINMAVDGTIVSLQEGSSPPPVPFNRYINKGEQVLLSFEDEDNEDFQYFTSRISFVSEDGFALEDPCPWTRNANVHLQPMRIISKGVVRRQVSNDTDRYRLINVTNAMRKGELIIGTSSFTIKELVEARVGTEELTLTKESFVQLTSYTGSSYQGTFVKDEEVYQGESWDKKTMSARVYKFAFEDIEGNIDQPRLYLTNITGTIKNEMDIKSRNNNGVLEKPLNKYTGDFQPMSGEIIFLQNDVPVLREEGTSEKIRVILEL